MRLTRKEERYIKEREIEPPISDFPELENEIKEAALGHQRKMAYERERLRKKRMKKEEMEKRQRREELKRQREKYYHEKY